MVSVFHHFLNYFKKNGGGGGGYGDHGGGDGDRERDGGGGGGEGLDKRDVDEKFCKQNKNIFLLFSLFSKIAIVILLYF